MLSQLWKELQNDMVLHNSIIAIITDIPLGKRRVKIGLKLRQAWFINGILFKSEAWSKINKSDIED